MRVLLLTTALTIPWMGAAGAEPLPPAGPMGSDLESELSPALNRAWIAKGIDGLVEGSKKRVSEAANPRAVLETLLRYLTQERSFHPEPPASSLQDLNMTSLLQTGRGAPETLALLYAELARRHGITLIPCYAPDRLLLRHDEGEARTFVDLADKAVGLTEAAYRLKLMLPDQGPWLDALSPAGLEAFLRRRRAEVLLAAGRPEKALLEAEKAATLDPGRAEHQMALARIRWAVADAAGARKALETARAIQDSADATLLESDLLAADGDAEAALAGYGKVLASGSVPLRLQALLARARLRSDEGRHDLALSDFRKALELGGGAPAAAGIQAEALGEDLSVLARRAAAFSPPSGDVKAQLLELIVQVRSSDEKIRQKARDRMTAMGARAIPYMKEALASTTPEVRLGALQLLSSAPDPACLEEALACLKPSEPPAVRLGALTALGIIAETDTLKTRILPVIREILEKIPPEGGEMARRAATVLARHRDPAAVPYFRRALEDANAENRRQAVLELGKIGDRASLPALRKALSDEHPRVRARAAQALAALTDKESLPGLIEALKDEDRDVCKEAESALKRLTGQDLGSDSAKWKTWQEEHP